MARSIGSGGVTDHDKLTGVSADDHHAEQHDHAGTAEGKEITPKVSQGRVYAGHSDFGSLQDALDFANNNGYYWIDVPEGTYGGIKPYKQQTIHGLSADFGAEINTEGDGEHAIDLFTNSANIVTIRNIQTTADSTKSGIYLEKFDRLDVRHCNFTKGDYHVQIVGGTDTCRSCRVIGNRFGSSGTADVLLDADTQVCVVALNTNTGTITDNGTGNVTTPNA